MLYSNKEVKNRPARQEITNDFKLEGRLTQHKYKWLAGDDSDKKSRTFVFKEGGHTFGNALRCIISRYPDVVMCGYTIPHPSEATMHFRIQTRKSAAIDVLKRGIEDLEKLCDHTLTVFQDEVTQFKAGN